MAPRAGLLLLVAALLPVAGCTQRRYAFPDQPEPQVWTAMKAAAYEPRYEQWHVLENSVAVWEDERRIEVYRRLRRDFATPDVGARREDAEWRLRMNLETRRTGAPEVVVLSRGWAVPAHAWIEADRYADEVRVLLDAAALGAPPAVAPPTPPSGEPPTPAASKPAGGSAPPVDLPE